MKIQLILPAVLALAALGAQASVFEVRAVEAKGAPKTTVFTIEDADKKTTYHLSNDVLLDRSALIEVRATEETVTVKSGAKPEKKVVAELQLKLTKDGVGKFKELTTALMDKQMGVVIDGKLVATPVVSGKGLQGNVVTLSGHFTKEEAVAMAEKINKGK